VSARQLDDDFGTGYGSLLYLRRYPIDIIQIDRVLVAGIGRSGEDEAICRSITSLAAAVGASSVGEGVETAEQYAVLRSKGCRHGQGVLWSPAVPIDQLGTAPAACDRTPPCTRSQRPSTARSGSTRRACAGPPVPWRGDCRP